MTSILTSVLASLLTMLSYTVELPFSSIDLPNETTLDRHGQELSFNYTMSEQQLEAYPSESVLVAELRERFEAAGVTFVTPMPSYYPKDENDVGRIDLLFGNNDIAIARRIFLNAGSHSCQVVQQGPAPEAVSLTVSPSGHMFPSPADSRTITMSGGINGKTYCLYCDGILKDIKECDSTGIVPFADVNSPGNYYVGREEGYTLDGGVTLSLHDVFTYGNHEIYSESYTYAVADGGLASVRGYIDTVIDADCIADLEEWYNTRQDDIDFWPDHGQHMTISFNEGMGEIDISLMCPPNFDQSPRTFDTRMRILFMDEEGTLTFTQPGGGSLVDYGVEKSDGSDGRFSVVLSGSQFKVTYELLHDGEVVMADIGTGHPLAFHNLSESGTYTVRASYQGRTLTLSDTVTASVPDEAGGTNYVSVSTYAGDGSEHFTDIIYYGGLGYPVQEVSAEHVFPGRNLIRPIVYDYMRRETKSYLPYSSDAINSRYTPSPLPAQQSYHDGLHPGEGQHAKVTRHYEDGPSGRLLEERREGSAYLSAIRDTRHVYRLSASGDAVMKLRYVYPSGSAAASVVRDGMYGDAELMVARTVSEDRDTSFVFTTASGRMVLSRQMNAGTAHDTYYVHDLRDSLVCVVQPMGSAAIGDGFSFDGELAQDFCFTYRYDAFGNMIERHVPGAGTEVMAYDLRGRCVMYADADMTAAGLCRYTVYDEIDRVVEEGYGRLGRTMEAVRDSLRGGAVMKSMLTQTAPLRTCTYYDAAVIPGGFRPESGVTEDADVDASRCRTMLKRERVYEDPYIDGTSVVTSGAWRDRTCFYDSMGRVIQTLEASSDGWTSRYSCRYDFAGNVTHSVERHSRGTQEDCLRTTYQYDRRGRVLTCQRSVNGQELPVVAYSYDDLGRLVGKSVPGRVVEHYSYNLQGWRDGQEVVLYGQPGAFWQELRHYDPQDGGSQPRYGGFVSESEDGHMSLLSHLSSYRYDPLGRITQAVREDSTGEYLQYDLNGNVTSLERIAGGDAVSVVDFSHDGNRMTASQDALGEENAAFTWWEDGNLKTDSKKNLRFRYNLGNLPTVLTQMGSSVPRAWMVYLADGTRVMTRSADGSGRAYRGSFVYSISGLSQTIESIAHDEGRFLAVQGASGTEFIDTWHVRDYLGSVRAVYDITPEPEDVISSGSQILEQNDYYAFGGRIDDPYQPYDQTNRYRYNGKEQLRFEGINIDPGLKDYGARYYAPTFGRWTSPDPLADKYYSISPYAFCNNNPVNFVDPDGAAVETAWDLASIGLGVRSLIRNVRSGNVRAAIGDGFGIAVDVAAAALPFVPGGVGAIRYGVKGMNMLDAGTDFLRLTGELQGFEKAAEFGVDSYKNLKKSVNSVYGTGSGLEVHHLVEQRFADQVGMKASNMPSIVLAKEEHKKFTAAWRQAIGYDKSGATIETSSANKEEILRAARDVYKDYQELFKVIEEAFK